MAPRSHARARMQRVTRVRLLVPAVVACALAATAIALAAGDPTNGIIGPKNHVQPNGRKLAPTGKLTKLGNHPGGGALTPNGRYLWVADAGRGINDIKIVDEVPELGCKAGSKGDSCRRRAQSKVGRVVQTIRMPGVSGGIAMSPNGKTAYVSGLKDSSNKDVSAPPGTPGAGGDVIHVFTYSKTTGKAVRAGLLPVPPPSGTSGPQVLPGGTGVGAPQSFPPTGTGAISWPRDLAVSRDGGTLLAALNLADRAAIVKLKTKTVKYVLLGRFPYGAAITRSGKGLISNEADGTVSVLDLKSGTKTKDISVGAHLSHPEGIAIDPKADRAYVAIASEDKIAVIDTAKMVVTRKLSVERSQGNGTQPVALSVTADGCRLLVADSGEDAVAVFALKSGCDTKPLSLGKPSKGKKPRRHRGGGQSEDAQGDRKVAVRPAAAKAKAFDLIGRVQTAAYPVFAGASNHR